MSYKEYRILKTNAGKKVGRPQKYSESWRREIAEKYPMTPKQYYMGIVNQIIKSNGRICYGYEQNGYFSEVKLEEFKAGKPVNCIKKIIPGQEPEYMNTQLFIQNYKEYVEKFNKIKRLATTGYASRLTNMPFEEGAGLNDNEGGNKQASKPAQPLPTEPFLKPKPTLDQKSEEVLA